MTNLVFNIAKGKVGQLATLPAANDALIAVVIESTGVVSDATMRDYDTLDAILSGASNEQTTMGRKTLTTVAVTTNDTDDRTEVSADDIVWTAATGNQVACVVICYDPDTTGGSDADLIPLVKLDMAVTPGGGDITLAFGAGGFYQAS